MASRSRILFVDDDPDLLETLQEVMSDMAEAWDMTFLSRASEGLAAFALAPFDVVVSDLWMPGMNGAEFLREIRALYPGSIRFILSSNTDRDLAIQLVERAHQFIEKPCRAAFLKTAISRTLCLRDHLHNEPVQELIGGMGQLPTVPTLYQEIPGFTPTTATHVANALCAVDPIHALFSRATLDAGYLASLGWNHSLEQWQALAGGQPV